MNAAVSTSRATAWLRDLKRGHQYLGRYSVKKLCAFHVYQKRASAFRVIAVIVLTPLPTILTLWGLECILLPDPRGGPKRQAVTFLRSILSHTIMTYTCLLCAKQAVGLCEPSTKYTHKKVALISLFVAVGIELWWLIWAFAWRYPVPCRELLGPIPWAIILVGLNYVFAKEELSQVWGRMRRYIPVVGTQIVIFYFLLLLSAAFAAVPWWAQLAMIFVFPVVKIAIKRALWKYARNLHDICADVTVCMVEISSALYQTVCVNYVRSNFMVLLLIALDFVQVAHETHLYVRHDYVGDSQSIVQAAVSIVESALRASIEAALPDEVTTDEQHAIEIPSRRSPALNPPGIQPLTGAVLPLQGSKPDLVARMLKGAFWHRRRRSRASRQSKYSAEAFGSEHGSVKPAIQRKSSVSRRNLLRKISSRAVLPIHGQRDTACSKSDMLTPRTNREEDSDDERLFGHRGTEIHGTDGVLIDDVFFRQREQGRVLEQTLQLLFAAEVLLFVEYVEVFMPLLYAACVGLWNMPNAKYNVLLGSMSFDSMAREVLTSLCYGALELVSFLFVYYFIRNKYGISALYQLAFLLESYAMTLQGKLVACFVIILNSTAMHQGIDLTFKFDWDALLKTSNPYSDA